VKYWGSMGRHSVFYKHLLTACHMKGWHFGLTCAQLSWLLVLAALISMATCLEPIISLRSRRGRGSSLHFSLSVLRFLKNIFKYVLGWGCYREDAWDTGTTAFGLRLEFLGASTETGPGSTRSIIERILDEWQSQERLKLGALVYVCNPSYLGGWD
jgi:hypothetical protein